MANARRRAKDHGQEPGTHSRVPTGISNQPLAQEPAIQARTEGHPESVQLDRTRQMGHAEGTDCVASTVRDVMTPHPTTLSASDPVKKAACAMRDGDIGDVLVVADGQIVGILTDRDIVIRAVAEDRDLSHTSLGEICSRAILALRPEDAVETAIATMREHAVRRLPVVEEGQPVGIVSLGDLAVERDPHSALGKISAAPPNQ
jgi:CBS domain-containing protein